MTDIIVLTNKLRELIKDWNQDYLVPKDQQTACRQIGEELNKIGGMDAMQAAYYAAKEHNRFASTIQAYWDGVGEWRW